MTELYTHITLPVTALFVWLLMRLDKKFKKMEQELEQVQKTLKSLNISISHIEGHFEKRDRLGTKNKQKQQNC